MKVYHFHNGTGGGVLSVIKNLFQFSINHDIENHIIHAVNKAVVSHYTIEPIGGAISQKLYYYTATNNFYHTCRQLAKLIPDEKAIIVAHDWVELGMASNLGMQNPVVHVLHGDFDYYYALAKKNDDIIDAYICISPKIFQSLEEILPGRVNDIFFLNFPAPPVLSKKNKPNNSLHLIYYVRDIKETRKQFSTVVEIARQLSFSEGDYFFTIAGGGLTTHEFFDMWPHNMKGKVNFVGQRSNTEILAMLSSQDIFLLPSLSEGLPISLVEAMKAGVVPLVTNWDGAADELIDPGVTGYYFNTGAATDYVACIKKLYSDRLLLNQLSAKCIQKANTLFDPVENTKKFEDLFLSIAAKKRKKKDSLKVYGSRLDQPFIPNFITHSLREIKKK